MNHHTRLPALVVCVLGAAGLAPIAGTASAANVPEVIVSYADLDLGNPTDLERLYTRLQTAADTVCIPTPAYELARFAAYQRCVQSVLERSVQQVRSPALLALHRASAGGHRRSSAHS